MNITADNQYLQAVVKRLFSRSSQYIVLQILTKFEPAGGKVTGVGSITKGLHSF